MTQKEKLANWMVNHPELVRDANSVYGIQSEIPGLEVKKVNSGALLVRFTPKDEWMDLESWYFNYVSNCSKRLREEVQRLRNVCSPERYAETLALFALIDNSDKHYVNGYDNCEVFLNTFKEFAKTNKVGSEAAADRWAQFLHNLEKGTLGWSHKVQVFKEHLWMKQ